MSLDLRLLPYDHDSENLSFSHTVLSCERHSELFDLIAKIEKHRGRKVNKGFNTFVSRDEKYEESHYGRTVETPYGESLKEVEVEELLRFVDIASQDSRNKAIWAYLAELPERTKVALYWH